MSMNNDTLENHPYPHMIVVQNHYRMNAKYKHLLDKVFIIFGRKHIYAGCNDAGTVYFKKPNRKKRYTIPGLPYSWLEDNK